jgi:AcrR family transcriptional regulator
MPKKVDHAARRLEIAEALWRLTRSDGWEAISLRKVAAEAGVSMGMVQHYFKTTDEMLRFALEVMSEDVRARIRRRIAALPEPHTPRLLVHTVLTEMIPHPARRRAEMDGAAVFIRRFLLAPASAAALAPGGVELNNGLVDQIRASRATRATATDSTAERDAAGLLALLDGLIFAIVTGQQTSETALAILETQLDYVFGTDQE